MSIKTKLDFHRKVRKFKMKTPNVVAHSMGPSKASQARWIFCELWRDRNSIFLCLNPKIHQLRIYTVRAHAVTMFILWSMRIKNKAESEKSQDQVFLYSRHLWHKLKTNFSNTPWVSAKERMCVELVGLASLKCCFLKFHVDFRLLFG